MTRRSTVSVRNAFSVRGSRIGRSSLVAVLALTACFVASVFVASDAEADRISQKKAEAARIAAQIDANYDTMSMLDEEILSAQHRVEELKAEIARSEQSVAASKQHMASLQDELAIRAASLYRNSGTAQIGATMGSVQEAAAQAVYAQSAASQDRAMIDRYRRAKDRANAATKRFEAAKAESQREADAAKAARKSLADTTARQQRLLAQTKGELASLIAQEQARREAQRQQAEREARQRAERERAREEAARGNGNTDVGGGSGSGSSGGSAEPPPSHIVAQNPRAQIAIDTAMAQIGKWYQYAASGPDRFDCSGLLVYSWAKAGVSIPHSSRALYASLPKVSRSQLQPGDFVYFGHPIHHVGMYIGGGMMVEAPHTGAKVRTRSIYRSDYVGATRVP